MAKRVCFFCESTQEITVEHAWPEWILQMFPTTNETWTAEYSQRGIVKRQERWSSPSTVEIKVKRYCKACNTGWMASLEDETKPILQPLIQGNQQNLSQVDQLLLATWATKTAMVFESMTPKLYVSSQEERNLVRTQKRPPARAVVRLGGYEGRHPLLQLRSVAYAGPTVESYVQNSYGSTLAIGKVFFQVLYRSPHSAYRPLEEGGISDYFYLTILPPSNEGSLWPPSHVLDDDGLLESHASMFPGVEIPEDFS